MDVKKVLGSKYYWLILYLTVIQFIGIQSLNAKDNKKLDVAKSHNEWINSLTPTGKSGSELTLAAEGKSDYILLLSKKPTTQDIKAAEDLQTWIKEMTGVTLNIERESGGLNKNSKLISIGWTKLLNQSGLSSTNEDLKDEGYGIDEKGGQLFLWGGRTRGIINAVYALLEEDLGCRWYSTDCIVIPHKETLEFTPVLRTYLPALRCRDPFWSVAFDPTWSLRNRTNSPSAKVPEKWGGCIDYDGMFVHTSNTLFPVKDYFEKHPEYYMLDDKNQRDAHQLCTTNPDVIRLVKEKVRKILKENPYTELISVSKNDGGGDHTCLCEKCKTLDDTEGTNMASLLVLVNAVAQDIEKDYPNVLISTLAYLETSKVPKTIKPRKNVSIMLCSDRIGAWRRPFEPAELCEIGTLVKDWSAVCKRLFIWDYDINFSHYLAPMPNMDVMAENIRFYIDHNAEGVMLQANYQTAGSERDCLRSWVAAKLLWNPALNLYDLMDDFIYGYFGKAAPPVLAYNKLLQRQKEIYKIELSGRWMLDHKYDAIRYEMDHPFLSKEFLVKATELYDNAENLAADMPQVLTRVQRDRLPIEYVKLMRGPDFIGDEYGIVLDRFEKIVRKIGLTYLSEGGKPNVDEKIELWRKQWNEYKSKQ